MQKKNPVEKLEKVEAPKNASEHLLNLLKATLSTIPFGGGIASLMTDYIPSMKQERLEKFVQEVSDDLRSLQDRINEDTIHTDEFAFIFEKCFKGAAENYQQAKLQAFRGILINTAIGSDIEADEGEYYLNLVERLSALHLRVLAFLANPQSYLLAHGIPEQNIRGGFPSFMPVAIPGADIEAIKGAFGDLYQIGLINTDRSMFNVMTSGQGLELLGDRLTEAGRRFIAFCTTPE
ncbi:hypothetical protein JQV19_17670 [Sulfitobacter mediterraneus]|uniref:hypothetical protein n=1 Tax=Sulfitobacter mediterraneus TaxID=83219 RepID=UPI0019396F8B|nr:hypothetical protein [Sulfitobacter mediterraneus]MBM1558546.1 hypothetical protein [Sulfitobacter mediterraneus]MBM1569760.1 hypothetical protein [Sulfitobacter mediterraneus]MBM1573719.1 hypothetical protein [Sulfitobacter mediterraneus]MBM1577548.1 hypothetical protein [Sulfitobacter mediterraneus]MBM1581534.1 hypothetical protein [Sulfitobacter mediterraneus]